MDDAWLEYIIRKADENQSIIREADKDQRVGALLSILDEADIVVAIWREQNQPRGVGHRVVTGQLLMQKSIERNEPIPAELTGTSTKRYDRAYGRRLRLTRIALDITEAEAAAAHGVTLRTYRRWEAGSPARCPRSGSGKNTTCRPIGWRAVRLSMSAEV